MRNRLLLIVACGLLVAADDKDDAVKKEKAKLKRTWTVESLTEPGGQAVPEKERKDMTIVITDDTLTVNLPDDDKKEYTYKIDPSKTPKTLDLIKPKEKDGGLGIYSLDADTLKIAVSDAGPSVRPKELKADKENKVSLVVLKRKKK
jgi:uncharacterized protein (TIGR03067 family)